MVIELRVTGSAEKQAMPHTYCQTRQRDQVLAVNKLALPASSLLGACCALNNQHESDGTIH